MTVKADSKGRLTGAQPETHYSRTEYPDGRIEYVPQGPKPSKEVTTLAISTGTTPRRLKVAVETELGDFSSAQELINRIAETTEAGEVWVKTSGMLAALFDLLGRTEQPYKLVGYNPSAKGFEGLE